MLILSRGFLIHRFMLFFESRTVPVCRAHGRLHAEGFHIRD